MKTNHQSPSPINSRENVLIDKFGRQISYVRLSVTDRCNLRCVYCMPREKMRFLPRDELLSFEEIVRLMHILASLGIRKVRITGGEPFVRKDIIKLIEFISEIEGIERIHITTNGILTSKFIPQLKEMGIRGINLSLDTLDSRKFYELTRRDNFKAVMDSFHKILEYEIPLKINTVLLDGINTDEIIPLSLLARDYPVDVRFIEEMPFNGNPHNPAKIRWDYRQILEVLFQEYPDITKIPDSPHSTSMNYRIPGFQGNVGVIAGYSRLFCGQCNRIRINAKGLLQTCLYGSPELNVKELLRKHDDDDIIKEALQTQVNKKYRNGWEAEKANIAARIANESMSIIGG
ncbi:MAG: GTP 3',8-cyclase MoaA [Calditrichaeota bacterium]|nr:MAG: GTP 3',8-cyclase MoaA [Calditrichota bacterium]